MAATIFRPLAIAAIALAAVATAQDEVRRYSDSHIQDITETLAGVETVFIIVKESDTDLDVSHSEVTDRIHLALMRGELEFLAVDDDDSAGSLWALTNSFIANNPKGVVAAVSYSIEDSVPSGMYTVQVSITILESVRTARNPEKWIEVITTEISYGGQAGSSVAVDALYRYASAAGQSFVQGWKLNNPDPPTAD